MLNKMLNRNKIKTIIRSKKREAGAGKKLRLLLFLYLL